MNKKEMLYSDIKVIVAVYVVLFLIRKVFGTVCYSRLLWGVECPFCGISRSLDLVLRGQFVEAFYMNPMIYFVIVWFGLFFVKRYFFVKLEKVLRVYTVICVALFIAVFMLKYV